MYGPGKDARWPTVDILPSRTGANLKLLWTIPFIVLMTALCCGLTLVFLPLVAISDFSRKSRWGGCRTMLFMSYFFLIEFFFLITVLLFLPIIWCLPSHRRSRVGWKFQERWACFQSAGIMKIFGVTMDVEGLEEMRDEPFILLIKHTSMADTTLPLFLFSVRRGALLRYVLKEEMLNNPLFNFVARMFPNIFIKRGSGDSESQYLRIAKLSEGLNPGDGVVIFPEGTRFSDEKRDRVQKKLAKSTNALLKDHAERIKNMLPLRAGGAAAAIQSAPNAHILFCGHVGFEGSRTMGHLWRGALIGNKIKVKFWCHAPETIPHDEDALEAWLYEQWERMDAWVTESYTLNNTGLS